MKNKTIEKYIKDAKDTLEIKGDIDLLPVEYQLTITGQIIEIAKMIQLEELQSKRGGL